MDSSSSIEEITFPLTEHSSSKKELKNTQTEVKYSETFEVDLESDSSSSSSTTTSTSNPVDLTNLKKSNYLEYLKRKILKEKNKKNLFPTCKKQIEKLINRIEIGNFVKSEEKLIKKSEIKLNEEFLNRIKTDNMIKKIEKEQFDKIEKMGLEETEKINMEIHEKVYLNTKISMIKSKMIDYHYDNHLLNYCDSITLIGNLAKSFRNINTL